MIRILVILIVISPMFGFAQTETYSEIELVGIWVLTDFDNPKKFSDTWEFRSDSIFNELKYKADGDTTLTIDAHGKWKLVGNNLTISIWGKMTMGSNDYTINLKK